MLTPRLKRTLAAIGLALAAVVATDARAQGITTGAISGVVTDSEGRPLEGVQVAITNSATGFTSRTVSREGGRYFVQGLEVGGPYNVLARRIGFAPQDRGNIQVGLSQNQRLDFRLEAQATTLTSIEVVGTPDVSASNSGTKTFVSDSALQRLPTLNRNLTDFIRLAPQVSTAGAGYSGGGMSNRMNNVQIDGATERDVFGLGSTGQPGAEVGSKSVSIEAVKQLQVLLAPFDVRQGNFGGLLLNAVSKSGTNELHGSGYFGYRDQNYGRDVPTLRSTQYQRKQYAFTLGGPIIRDRLNFFFAPEFQSETEPVSGPFVGQAADAANPLQIGQADIDRYESIMRNKYKTDPGTAGQVEIPNPLQNFFGRLDYRLSDAHRVVFRYNYSYGERLRQQNSRTVNRLVYSDNFHTFSAVKNAPVIQIFSNFSGGSSNELFIGYNGYKHNRVPPTLFPQVTVTVPRTGGGNATIVGGADQSSQGNSLDTDTYELTNNFTKPIGDHNLTIGTRNEYVKLRNLFSEGSYGVWTFTNLNNFDNGVASSFRRAFLLKDEGNAYFDALQSAFYVQDQWQARPNVSFTLGARADVSSFLRDVGYSAPIDTAYGRNTNDVPKRAFQFSPRVAFSWDVTSDQANTLRGGVGMFVGTPPYVWLENAYINNGLIITNLNCSGTSPAPAFNVDATVYNTCANGQGTKPIGRVSFLDKDLKFPQPLRATLAYDRRLPGNLVGTVEGLFSKTINQLFFVNRNIQAPRGVDKRGRILYGDTILLTGQAFASLPPAVRANGGLARFSEAIDLINQSKDFSYSLTGQLQKRFADNWEGMAAYTFSRSRDVQSFSSSTHGSNWRFGRTLSGDQLDPYTAVSNFDQPHKLVASGTYSFKWRGDFSTDISMFYTGASGGPHDYVYGFGPASNSGDLNADGSQGNDLIYVPADARNQAEIRFRDIAAAGGNPAITAAAQAEAFENFINNSPCLSKNRGRIMERNVCRLPFLNRMDLSLRQAIPTLAGQRVSVQLDIFNFGNLLNKKWGQEQINQASNNSNVPILSHVGQTVIDPKTADPIFTFNTTQQEYVTGNFASNYWRTQISFRYSF